MRVYSDLLNKPFDTEEECIKAEKAFKAEQKRQQEEIDRIVAERKAKEEALNVSKKELSKAIEDATKKADEANSLYEAVKEKAQSILNEAKKQANDLLESARAKVREAEKEKYEAIAAFNKKFGTYTTTLTGEKAAKEYNNVVRRFSDFWNSFWNF